MQSYISHRRSRVFNPLIFFFSFLSLSCFIDLLRKITEIIENMIFSLIFVLRNCGKSRKYDIYVERFYENVIFHAVRKHAVFES